MTRRQMELEKRRIADAAWIAGGTIEELYVQLREAKERIAYLEKILKRRALKPEVKP